MEINKEKWQINEKNHMNKNRLLDNINDNKNISRNWYLLSYSMHQVLC